MAGPLRFQSLPGTESSSGFVVASAARGDHERGYLLRLRDGVAGRLCRRARASVELVSRSGSGLCPARVLLVTPPARRFGTFTPARGQLRPHLWAPPPHIATPRARHRSEARLPSAPRTAPI